MSLDLLDAEEVWAPGPDDALAIGAALDLVGVDWLNVASDTAKVMKTGAKVYSQATGHDDGSTSTDAQQAQAQAQVIAAAQAEKSASAQRTGIIAAGAVGLALAVLLAILKRRSG